MHRSFIAFAILGSTLLGGSAWAATEELAAETARQEIAQSSGVVFVDLFAHW